MSLAAFRENRSVLKRRAIVDAATRLFAEQGLTAVTMANLAAAAGVSTATLYRYFTAKEDVFACVIEELVHGFDDADDPATDLPEDGIHRLALRYANVLGNNTVLGLLRAVVAAPDQGSGFRERLESHGNAIFLLDFEREIRTALAHHQRLADHGVIQQACLELRGALEHVTLVPGLLFRETPAPEDLTRQVSRIVDEWKRHWLS